MSAEIVLTEDVARTIDSAFSATRNETLAIGYAGVSRTAASERLIVHDVEIPEPDAYRRRGEGHLSPSSAYVAGVVLRALARDARPVFFHSHPGARWPEFSSIDTRTHEELMPSILRQLEPPVASVVWGPGGWNAELWTASAHAPASVRVSGRRLALYGRSGHYEQSRYTRQTMAFGERAQEQFGALHAGIVGCGGNGSLVGQASAHVGITKFTLIDPDVLEASNTSRVVGSRADDVGSAKVAITARSIRAIRHEAQINAVQGDVRDCQTVMQLRDCDVVFGCTDSHSSRIVLNQLAYQYAIPLVDMGSLIRVDKGRVSAAFSDLRTVGPGRPCLLCLGAIDTRLATEEMLPPEDRREFRERGYLVGDADGPAASVLALNSVTAGLAQLRLLDLVAPWTEWSNRVTLELRELRTVERDGRSDEKCPVCGKSAPIGRGDLVPLRCRP